jgi:hypothetical protein
VGDVSAKVSCSSTLYKSVGQRSGRSMSVNLLNWATVHSIVD